MFRNRKIILSLIPGLLLSGIAFYFVFRDSRLQELVAYLKTVDYWWVFPSVAVTVISFWIRVVRWQLLLSPFKKTGFWRAHHPLMIGFMLNCLLPARAGEIARPAILYKREKVSFAKVLATVGAERVFDVIVLLVSFVLVLLAVDISPNIHTSFGDYQLDRETLHALGMTTLQVCLFMIACIVFVSVSRTRMLMKRFIMWLPELLFFAGSPFREKVRDRVCSRIVQILDNIAAGLGLLKDPAKFGLCLGLSFVVWGAQGFSYYLISLGCPGIGLSYLEMYASMVILCFFISLPSAPGFWGLWEAGGVFALLVFGVQDAEAAKGFTLMNHVFQMLPVIVIGVISAVITGVSVVEVAYADVEEQRPNNAPELG